MYHNQQTTAKQKAKVMNSESSTIPFSGNAEDTTELERYLLKKQVEEVKKGTFSKIKEFEQKNNIKSKKKKLTSHNNAVNDKKPPIESKKNNNFGRENNKLITPDERTSLQVINIDENS